MKGIVAALFAVGAFGSLAASAQQVVEQPFQGIYSVALLKDPLFDSAAVTVRTTQLNNWLAGGIRNMNYAQMQAMREDLYYLIESRIKRRYAEEKRALPKKHDPLLETLSSWSEPLGVYGGADAFNAVKAADTPSKKSRLTLPAGIQLSLNDDLFAIRSDRGWSIRMPYYFMISQIGDFIATSGSRTQLVGFSTGAARDKGKLGYSQATILFLYSPPEVGFDSLEAYWLKQIGIEASSKKIPLDVRTLQSRQAFDPALKMHKEMTAWSDATGSYAVFYGGLEGTFEWNRPHFLDFLRSIETMEVSRPAD